MRYLTYTHRDLPAWRLIVREDLGLPAGTDPAQWLHTRVREAADTDADVRAEVNAQGWHLFRLGGTFEMIESERAERKDQPR